MVPVAGAFGMEVIAWSQNLDAARAEEAGARAVGKDELFAVFFADGVADIEAWLDGGAERRLTPGP
jgi:hypothetical protein